MPSRDAILAVLVVALGGGGTFLMLPRRPATAFAAREYAAGAVAASLGLLLFVSFWSPPGPFLPTVFFYLFSVAALVGGVLTVTSRNPVYSALWFASVVLATAGLFLLAGAPFLAAGTVIVYAGAIIVTFLFVIMLAQTEGKAPYDRAARSPGPATLTCFLMLWCLIYALSTLKTQPAGAAADGEVRASAKQSLRRVHDIATAYRPQSGTVHLAVVDRALPQFALIRDSAGVDKPNVAGLGESLYTVHLVTVGLAGVLLFVALVGAVAITNPRRADRPGPAPAAVRASR
jgi:NADH-quinone oxidoreductase subunit J